jgi:hypothetical protein
MPELLEKILREKGAPPQAIQKSKMIVQQHKKDIAPSKTLSRSSSQPSLQQVVGPPKPVEQPSMVEVTKPEPVVSTRPIAEFTQKTGLPLWKAFPTETPAIPESKQKEYQQSMYATMPIVPGPVSKQITPPVEIVKAGATKEYKHAAYEQYLGVKGTGQSQLEKKLLQSEWYAGTQPIYKIEGKKKLLTFAELKTEEPALYLTRKKGLWTPAIDTVRWRGEQEKLLGGGTSAALHVSEIPRYMFDIDYYFAENKELYRSERLYQTYKETKVGKYLEPWVGYQIPAYANFIIPAATGYGMGKVFTGVKLAGGVKQASRLLKIGYGAGVAGMGAGIGVTGYQVVSGGFSIKDIAKIGFQGLVGATGFYGGRAAALSGFKSKYPNLEWRYTKRITYYDESGRLIVKSEPGVEPVLGKQYVKFKEMMIKGEGKPIRESGMYQYSQMFKPSGKPELYIGFPGSEIRPSRGGIDVFYIKEPGMQKIGGVVDITSKPYQTIFGERAWSMKGFLGTTQREYTPGSFDTGSILYRAGGVNIIKQGVYSRNIMKDISASQSLLFGGLKTIEPISTTSFIKPAMGYAPSSWGIGLVTPSFKYEFVEPTIKFKPEISFKYEPHIKKIPGILSSSILEQPHPVFRYETKVKPRYESIMSSGYESFFRESPAQIQEPVFGYDIGNVQKYAPVSAQMTGYIHKTPEIEIPKSPYKMPKPLLFPKFFGGYGGWAWGSFDKILGVGYRHRKHRVPTLKDLIGW